MPKIPRLRDGAVLRAHIALAIVPACHLGNLSPVFLAALQTGPLGIFVAHAPHFAVNTKRVPVLCGYGNGVKS